MMEKSFLSQSLSLQDTNVLKGIAILLVLFHHLWLVGDEFLQLGDGMVTPLEEKLRFICISGKISVAIFVFLSGYGLSKSYYRNIRFYLIHRFTKLYFNYWLIWLLFVPLGVFVFNRTFTDVFHDNIIPKVLVNLSGLTYCFGAWGYNPTWWFYSCIILLYIIYPFIHNTIKFWYLWLLFGAGFIPLYTQLSSQFPELHFLWIFLKPIKSYLGVFIFGIFFSHFNIIDLKKRIKNLVIDIILWGGMLVVACIRIDSGWEGMKIDPYLTIMFVLAYSTIGGMNVLKKGLAFLGKHSFNIFLFHTFILTYYFPYFIYSMPHPILQYLALLISCVLVSLLIEKIKQIIRFNDLSRWIENRLYNPQEG